MKAQSLALLMFIALGHLAHSVQLDEHVTPQNLDQQPFKFSIVAEKHGRLVTFRVSAAAKNPEQSLLFLEPVLILMNSKKELVATTLVEAKKKADLVEVREFHVSADYLDHSQFEFTTDGAAFFFRLKDFIKD